MRSNNSPQECKPESKQDRITLNYTANKQTNTGVQVNFFFFKEKEKQPNMRVF